MDLLKRCRDGWWNHPWWWITTNNGYDLISRKFQSWMETNDNVVCKYPCGSLKWDNKNKQKCTFIVNVLLNLDFYGFCESLLRTCKLPQPFRGIRIVASGFPFPVILQELKVVKKQWLINKITPTLWYKSWICLVTLFQIVLTFLPMPVIICINYSMEIPLKFHLNIHVPSCTIQLSFRFVKGDTWWDLVQLCDGPIKGSIEG